MQQIKTLFSQIANNKKIVENYFFMTALQILNSLFYLLIYPYVIRVLGMENFGLYVFAFSITSYFSVLIQFGFDTPALKVISQNQSDNKIHSQTISTVLCAKLWMLLLSLVIIILLILTIPTFKTNILLFSICFFQVFSTILFPTWYFQGIQQMKMVTYIQLMMKLLSLPMIFLFVKQTDDVVIYAAITIATTVFGSIAAMMILWRKYRIRLLWIPVNQLKIWYKDATPFFLTTSMNTIKQETAKVFIGAFFSMSDVALYDLAMKIYSVPTILISSINGAMFPKMITNIRKKVIQKILTIENCIGITVIILLAVFGKWIIVLLGSETMLDAYPLLVILSFGIFTPLTVGAIINFIFVPMHKYYLIIKNQLIACIVFIVGALTGILMNNGGVIIVPIALTLSCFAEIIFCYLMVKKIWKANKY